MTKEQHRFLHSLAAIANYYVSFGRVIRRSDDNNVGRWKACRQQAMLDRLGKARGPVGMGRVGLDELLQDLASQLLVGRWRERPRREGQRGRCNTEQKYRVGSPGGRV